MEPNRAAWKVHPAPLAVSIAVLLTVPTPGDAGPQTAVTRLLSDTWSQDAAPAEGYDFVLDLDPNVIYLGGLILNDHANCIHGHGAVIDLQGESLWMVGYADRLDVDEVVFINGGSGPLSGGLHYASSTKGHVRGCVFVGCTIGLRMEAIFAVPYESSVTNCIFTDNAHHGAMFHDVYTPSVLTCAAWGNGTSASDDYSIYCGCPSEDPASWSPPSGNGCFHDDPMLVSPVLDHDTCDFHLLAGSPCWGSGTPAGTHIGAYPDAALAVRMTSWGRLKSAYARP